MSSPGAARLAARIWEIKLPGYGEDEVGFLAGVLELARPTHVFEWGTNRGSSARIFWEAREILGLDYAVVSVELPIEEAYRDRDHPGIDHGLFVRDLPVTLLRGEGVVVACGLARDTERPLFFVDGDHTYPNVLNELQMIATHCPTAPIVLHDSRHIPSVATSIEEFLDSSLGRHYLRETFLSQAGMTALWPT